MRSRPHRPKTAPFGRLPAAHPYSHLGQRQSRPLGPDSRERPSISTQMPAVDRQLFTPNPPEAGRPARARGSLFHYHSTTRNGCLSLCRESGVRSARGIISEISRTRPSRRCRSPRRSRQRVHGRSRPAFRPCSGSRAAAAYSSAWTAIADDKHAVAARVPATDGPAGSFRLAGFILPLPCVAGIRTTAPGRPPGHDPERNRTSRAWWSPTDGQ